MTVSFLEIILYVSNQKRSRDFYAAILKKQPSLEVPGMTEFLLMENVKLGLMPETGIAKILRDKAPHPATGNGIPRCELYLFVDEIENTWELSIQSGAKEISPVQERTWGDMVGYVLDFDGHVIAFAQKK